MKIWVLVLKEDPTQFAFGIGRTAAEAYRTTGELFGGTDRPWTTEQLKKEGYKAVKADVVLR
jgi:hypothetical protein